LQLNNTATVRAKKAATREPASREPTIVPGRAATVRAKKAATREPASREPTIVPGRAATVRAKEVLIAGGASAILRRGHRFTLGVESSISDSCPVEYSSFSRIRRWRNRG